MSIRYLVRPICATRTAELAAARVVYTTRELLPAIALITGQPYYTLHAYGYEMHASRWRARFIVSNRHGHYTGYVTLLT